MYLVSWTVLILFAFRVINWLVDRNFSSLLFSDQFMYTAIFAMGSRDQVLKGHFYGGSAIIYWANLASVISVCATNSDCFCAMIYHVVRNCL